MILVGQYDSPFVRRVAIALHEYGLPFERRSLSVFKDFDAMLALNPAGKVPSLVLETGETLFDSCAIIDFLDGEAPPAHRLAPADQPARRRVLQLEVMGITLAEKTYERGIERNRRAPTTRDPAWAARLERQILSLSTWLEAEAAGGWFHGDRFTRADLAVAVAVQYRDRVVPRLGGPDCFPKLDTHRRRCEARPSFQRVPDAVDEALRSGWQGSA
ncbi:MAG: glutathione S-transferase family protein [Pseudomonadota bacterium]